MIKNKSNNLFYDNNINQLHSLIKNKEISYIDVIKETIQKTIEFDPKYHLWASFDEKELLSHIDNKRMPTSSDNDLTGIPVAVKDIFNTITLPTQMGSPLWKDFNAGNDARVVSNLKEAGAIVAGKTVTAEFAVHALNETLNPHDILLTPGTSSSGSAVAIAMGVCPVALATQTAGSIVRPASFNGIYGYKPSFGLVPRTGMLKTTDTLDTVGFFTIHYKDILKVFEAIRVKGKNYPISNEALTDKNRQYKDKSRPWRVAFFKTYTWGDAEDYAKNIMKSYIKKLENLNDLEVQEVELPSKFEKIHKLHSTIYKKALSYYFSNEYQDFDKMSEKMVDLIENGLKISPTEYYNAIQEQNDLCYSMDEILKQHDVLISLSTSGVAPPREIEEKPDPSLIWNTLQLPVVAVPMFVNIKNLPFGFQICSRKYNDYLLLNFLDYLGEKDMIPEKSNPSLL